MEVWREPDSIFAPLIVGGRFEAAPACGSGSALLAAAGSVPQTACTYTVKRPGKFRRETELRPRILGTLIGEEAKPYYVRVRLVDVPAGQTAAGAPLANRQWEVGLRLMKKGAFAPAIPDHLDAAFLEVSMYRIGGLGIIGGSQLALLRHLWILSLKACDPDLIVIGGQDGWSDDWWLDSPLTPELAG